MFWETYGSTVRWMFAAGALLGGIVLFTIFAWFYPYEPGDQFGGAFVMAVWGSVAGILTAAVASLVYRLWLGLWTRNPTRSVASRAWTGAGAAGLGALALWAPVWAVSGVPGLWIVVCAGLVPPLLAMLVAGPLTARAARRAGRIAQEEEADVPSENLA